MERKENNVIQSAFKNKAYLENSDYCGCYHCTKIFTPELITDYVDNGQTALCPFCQIDSVIGSSMGYTITTEFLEEERIKSF
jgi:hypothetical protein